VYEHVAPEQLAGGLTVVQAISLHVPGRSLPDHLPSAGEDFPAPAHLAPLRRRAMTIIVLPNGKLRLADDLPPDALATDSIVYRYDPEHGEYFLIGPEERIRPETVEDFSSVYAIPTFFGLDAALGDYAERRARYGHYADLKFVWRDANRLMFMPKPERHMRRSLEDFLDVSLRDAADVLPEQNVDEDHPADLRISFSHTNRVAFVEIKWLGKSSAPNGSSVTEYSESRAKAGARQLAEYLDSHYVRAHGKILMGYLVVFDARRRNVSPATTSVSRADGLHYEHRDIDYDADLLARPDFAAPRRMFMEPICA
jgi:hypothetical protein